MKITFKKALTMTLVCSIVAAGVSVVTVQKVQAKDEQEDTDQEVKVVPMDTADYEETVEIPGIVIEKYVFDPNQLSDELNDEDFMITKCDTLSVQGGYQTDKKLANTSVVLPGSTYQGIYDVDVTVSAGVDPSEFTYLVDDDNHIITVQIPEAEIYGEAVIDQDSLVWHDTKDTGLFGKPDDAKFNDSLAEVQEDAIEMATENGLISEASENAKELVTEQVQAIVDAVNPPVDYSVNVEVMVRYK